MSRKYNFYAGPATLPLSVLEEMQKEFVDFKGAGLSLIETSHRSKEYDEIHNEAVTLVKELLGLSDEFKVMLLQGGATMQFGMLPLNLIHGQGRAAFTLTGAWAGKAYKDAKLVGEATVAWDGAAESFMSLPGSGDLQVDDDSIYLHVTSNETIGGVQWKQWPDVNVPLVADMSSDMMSRPLPMEKFGAIYAGAQKNLGPAGMTLVIMRTDLLDKCVDGLPAYLSYKTHASKNSLYNTPPVFSIWAFGKVMRWVKAMGGLAAMSDLADTRAGMIYDAMERSDGFYRCPVAAGVRSNMNVVWRLPREELEKKFVAEALELGMVGLKGHRDVGGIRASIYNAMPVEGVEKLVAMMDSFRKANA